MSELSSSDPTRPYTPCPTPVDGGASVLEALAASLPDVPRVHLREPNTEGFTPVNLPGSLEMPDGSRIHPAPARLLLIGEIGRGGMGAVLKGRDADLGRDVAVKVLLEEHRGESELVQRFVEEAQIAGQLQHPGIVPVYELGAFGDRRPYFSMNRSGGKRCRRCCASAETPPTIGRACWPS